MTEKKRLLSDVLLEMTSGDRWFYFHLPAYDRANWIRMVEEAKAKEQAELDH